MTAFPSMSILNDLGERLDCFEQLAVEVLIVDELDHVRVELEVAVPQEAPEHQPDLISDFLSVYALDPSEVFFELVRTWYSEAGFLPGNEFDGG